MSRPGGGPQMSELVGLGLAITALLLVFPGLGWLLDSVLDSFPAFVLVGFAIGIGAAGTYTYLQFKKFMQQ